MIRGRRFFCEDVNRSTGDLLFLQRIRERQFVENFAARVVDDQQVRPAFVEQAITIQQVLGAFAAGDVKGDDIDLPKELVKITNQLHFAIQSGRRGKVGIES